MIVLSFPAFSQPDNATVETINGKKYYVHFVEQGNTLYGIHKLYNTTIETLLAENEGLSNDLIVGQKILIPIQTSDKKHYGTHIVSSGETLYGISKTYACTVADIVALNDDLTEGISPGQEIIVPKKESDQQNGEVIQSDPVVTNEKIPDDQYSFTLQDSIVEHTVLPHETLYSIAKRYMVSSDTIMVLNNMRNTRIKKGDILKIPIKKVNYTVLEKDLTNLTSSDSILLVKEETEFKQSYNIALLLPLMLNKNDQEMGKPIRADEFREMYGTTKIAFDFYQGCFACCRFIGRCRFEC